MYLRCNQCQVLWDIDENLDRSCTCGNLGQREGIISNKDYCTLYIDIPQEERILLKKKRKERIIKDKNLALTLYWASKEYKKHLGVKLEKSTNRRVTPPDNKRE